MFDRTLAAAMAFFIQLVVLLPKDSWVCKFLTYLRLTFLWSSFFNFTAAQVDSYLFVKEGQNYPNKMNNATASKIAHGSKWGPFILGIIFGFIYPKYFDCQQEKLYFQRTDNILVLGVPSFVATIVNIWVTSYISYKLIKKIRQLSPHGPVNQAVKYNVVLKQTRCF